MSSRGKVQFSSWLQEIHHMVDSFQSRNIRAKGHGGAKLLSSWRPIVLNPVKGDLLSETLVWHDVAALFVKEMGTMVMKGRGTGRMRSKEEGGRQGGSKEGKGRGQEKGWKYSRGTKPTRSGSGPDKHHPHTSMTDSDTTKVCFTNPLGPKPA